MVELGLQSSCLFVLGHLFAAVVVMLGVLAHVLLGLGGGVGDEV